MFDQIRRLMKHSMIYGTGSILQSLAGFVLIPIYTKYFSPEEYGQLEVSNSMIMILVMVLTISLPGAILKVRERDCNNEEEKNSLVLNSILISFPFSVIVLGLMYFNSDLIATWFLGGSQYAELVQIQVGIVGLTIPLQMTLADARAREKSKVYTTISLLRFGIMMVGALILIAWLKYGVSGALWANFLSISIVMVLSMVALWRGFSLRIRRNLLKSLFYFGIANVPATLAFWFLNLSDRYIIEHFRGLSEVGIYSLGYRFGWVVQFMLVIPFQLAWPTVAFSVAERNDARQIYKKVLSYFSLVAVFLALGLTVFSPTIIQLIASPDYWPGVYVVPIVSFAYIFAGWHNIFCIGLHLKNKTKYLPLFVVIPAIINVGANILLVPIFGMIAAAWVTLGSFILVALITYFGTNKFYKLKYEWWRLVKLFFSFAVALCFYLAFIQNENAWGNVLVGFGSLILFIVLIWLSRFFSQEEISGLKNYLSERVKRKRVH